MTPILLGLGALLLLAGGKSAPKRPRLPGPMPKLVIPGSTLATPKGSDVQPYDVKIGPIKILKQTPTKVTTPSTVDTPLAESPSQGGGPPLAPPLSADIPTDEMMPSAPSSASTSRSQAPSNAEAARKAAASTANHLRRSGKAKYDRRMLRQWQIHAGLPADGLYGPATRGALIYFGVKDPPAAFVGTGTVPFRPDYLFPLNYTPKG